MKSLEEIGRVIDSRIKELAARIPEDSAKEEIQADSQSLHIIEAEEKSLYERLGQKVYEQEKQNPVYEEDIKKISEKHQEAIALKKQLMKNECSNCGLTVKPGAKFCIHCGARIVIEGDEKNEESE